MLATLFGKKKLTEDKIANVFVNTLFSVVEESFADIVNGIINDPEFERVPNMNPQDSDRFIMIVLAGNLCYLPRYFSAHEETLIKGKIIEKVANVYGLTYTEMNKLVNEYTDFIYRVNHPSKNILYGMSKAIFFKYKLGQYQDKYFAQLNAPNPIFLKRMDTVMENYLWDWGNFFDKYKFSPTEH